MRKKIGYMMGLMASSFLFLVPGSVLGYAMDEERTTCEAVLSSGADEVDRIFLQDMEYRVYFHEEEQRIYFVREHPYDSSGEIGDRLGACFEGMAFDRGIDTQRNESGTFEVMEPAASTSVSSPYELDGSRGIDTQ